MSIRSRLALWYGVLLALVLAATLSVAFAVHQRTHEDDVDASLVSSWQHAVSELRSTAMPMPMRAVTLSAPTQAGSAPTATWFIASGGSPIAVGDANDSVLSHFDAVVVRDGLTDTIVAGARVRAYAGPVTDGKHDVTVCKPPSSRSCASAGVAPLVSAASNVSGRAPSARRRTTDNGLRLSRVSERNIGSSPLCSPASTP